MAGKDIDEKRELSAVALTILDIDGTMIHCPSMPNQTTIHLDYDDDGKETKKTEKTSRHTYLGAETNKMAQVYWANRQSDRAEACADAGFQHQSAIVTSKPTIDDLVCLAAVDLMGEHGNIGAGDNESGELHAQFNCAVQNKTGDGFHVVKVDVTLAGPIEDRKVCFTQTPSPLPVELAAPNIFIVRDSSQKKHAFSALCNQTGARPDDCIVVDDRESVLADARSMGMETVSAATAVEEHATREMSAMGRHTIHESEATLDHCAYHCEDGIFDQLLKADLPSPRTTDSDTARPQTP